MAFVRNLAQIPPHNYDRNDPLGDSLLFWAPLTEHAGTLAWSPATSNVRGTFTGGATWSAGGPTGSCVNLPGSGTLNFSSPNSFHIIGALTLSVWVNYANYTNYNGMITKTNAGGFPAPIDWYTLNSGDGHSRIFLGDNGTNYVFTQATNVAPLGVWNHVVVTITTTIANQNPIGLHYLNGAANGGGTFSMAGFDGTDGTTNLLIGNRSDGVTQANAKFADVRIYGRCFTHSEVRMLYLDGLRPMLTRRRVIVPKPAAGAPAYRARVVRWG
jgi:Concanavalin A-like lectin/glucanases superfamily